MYGLKPCAIEKPTPRSAHPSSGGDPQASIFKNPLHWRGGRRPGWVRGITFVLCSMVISDSAGSRTLPDNPLRPGWNRALQLGKTFSKDWKPATVLQL